MPVIDSLIGTTPLTSARAETIKKTYLLLGLSVAGAFCGGYVGAQIGRFGEPFHGLAGLDPGDGTAQLHSAYRHGGPS